MNPRLVVLIAALALPAMAAAQDRGTPHASLPAFRSDRDLARFLSSVLPPPAPPRALVAAAPAQDVCIAPPASPPPDDAWPDEQTQEQAVITGRVTNVHCDPEAAVLVRIESLHAGASTGADGTYRLVVPAWHIQPGQAVQITASRQGLSPLSRSITLSPGARLTQNFTLAAQIILLEDVVASATVGAAESITNNQHEGVDEGGIVKRRGDYLVILHRGRLFTVDVGGGRLRPVSAVNAFGGDGEPDAWYDEMLVSGETVVVIGFSYEHRGTEISLFHMDHKGGLHYRETYHLRSYDYYSSRNYASRLIGSKLVMYAPVPVPRGQELAGWMPSMRRWHPDTREGEFRRTLAASRVYRPGQPLHRRDDPTLHTVTTCDLARPRMECESSAVLGPENRVFYVSHRAVYVWTRGSSLDMVYRLPLDGSAPSALQAEGMPVDQFSFLESGDGHLNVLLRSGAQGDGMWGAEYAAGDVRLLRVPLRRFGGGRARARARDYRALPEPGGDRDEFHNRFVGRHVLYGTRGEWHDPAPESRVLYAVRWDNGRLAELPLPHDVDRIEVMGADAVVVGTDSADLHFTGVHLQREPQVAQRYVHPGAQQGEERSHGFFYRADAPDEGVIGLPIIGAEDPEDTHLLHPSASVLFVQNRDAAFRSLGELAASSESTENEDDGCIASCVDWYGSSRPIFMDGRILALLGYEIVEGALVDGRIREVRRVSFAPPAAEAAKH